MPLAMNRELADNYLWADNQLLPTTEQMNIPNYCYWAVKHTDNHQLGGENEMP